MTDGLYIQNTWVDGAETLRFTYQGNDLTKPDTLQNSYSSSLTLPDNQLVRNLTQNAQLMHARSRAAYRLLDAFVLQNGVRVFDGVAKLTEYTEGWNVELVERKGTLFDRLNRLLSTTDMSAHDFVWNADAVRSHAVNAAGIVFPLIQYGTLQNEEIANDTLFPAPYLKTIFETMVAEEGYRVTGLTDSLFYQHAILPFCLEKPVARDPAFVSDRQARVTVATSRQHRISGNTFGAQRFNLLLPLSVVDRPLQGFSQGKKNNFQPNLNAYRADVPMRVAINASFKYRVTVQVGGFEVYMYVEKNGAVVAETRNAHTGPYNLIESGEDVITINPTLNLAANVECQPGDLLRIRVVANHFTDVVNFTFTGYEDDSCFALFAPDATVRPGDTWPVAANLPPVTGLQLLKTIAFSQCGTWAVNERRKELRFVPLQRLYDNLPNAKDWSSKVDSGSSATWTPKIGEYGQRNIARWKKGSDPLADYAVGYVDCDADTLASEYTLFELPFSACLSAASGVANLDTVPVVPIRNVTSSGGTVSVTNTATDPRILLVSLTDTRVLKTVAYVNGKFVADYVPLRVCWFDKRPLAIRTTTPNVNLSFTANPGEAENSLLDLYFGALVRLLRRPRTLNARINLTPVDVASLDFGLPVRLRGARAGSTVLNDAYYYVNKAPDYVRGTPTKVTLIALT